MSAQKILIGTLSALLAGMTIGILIAPAKGTETRQKISDSTKSLKKRLRRFVGRSQDELDEIKILIENEVNGLKADVKEKILKLIETSKRRHNHYQEETV